MISGRFSFGTAFDTFDSPTEIIGAGSHDTGNVRAVEEAFQLARSGVPGPVCVECPVDLLYDEALIRQWYADAAGKGSALPDRLLRWYLNRHARRMFEGGAESGAAQVRPVDVPQASDRCIAAARTAVERAARPLLVIGSQAVVLAEEAERLAAAVGRLGIPVYLSGMARGLPGHNHPLQMRHQRRQALREADCVLLAGVPCDFRLDYGRHVRRSATLMTSQGLLDLLAEGPTPAEEAAGVRSAVVSVVTGEPLVVTAEQAGVDGPQVSSGTVVIVLEPQFTELLSGEQVLVLGEVVTTLAVGPVRNVVFVDEDGSAYLYWGQGRCKAVRLNDDMISFDRAAVRDITPPGYNEGPFVHKRRGTYYLSWSEFDTRDPRYSVAYGTGASPVGAGAPGSSSSSIVSPGPGGGERHPTPMSWTKRPGGDVTGKDERHLG